MRGPRRQQQELEDLVHTDLMGRRHISIQRAHSTVESVEMRRINKSRELAIRERERERELAIWYWRGRRCYFYTGLVKEGRRGSETDWYSTGSAVNTLIGRHYVRIKYLYVFS